MPIQNTAIHTTDRKQNTQFSDAARPKLPQNKYTEHCKTNTFQISTFGMGYIGFY